MFARIVAPHLQRFDIGLHQPRLAFESVPHRLLDHFEIQIQQRDQCAHIDHILEQLALARGVINLGAHLRDGNAQHSDILAREEARQAGIVNQKAAGHDIRQILRIRLRVHRHHDVDAVAPGAPGGVGDTHLIPGGKPLNVRRKNVFRHHAEAHAEQ